MKEKKRYTLSEYNEEIRNEILLMALTFRVSKSNLCKIFSTTSEDIDVLFSMNQNLKTPLYYLDLETKGEDEINSRVAYAHALEYWKNRNKLIKQLTKIPTKIAELENLLNLFNLKSNEAFLNFKKEFELDKLEIKNKLKKLREQVDDTVVFNIVNSKKRVLDEKEWKIIVKYRLKYYLSLNECSKRIHRDKYTIAQHEAELAEKDPIYAEKLDLLNKGHNKKSKYIKNNYYYQKLEEKNIQTEFKGKQDVNLEYFNHSIEPQIDEVLDNSSFSRGGDLTNLEKLVTIVNLYKKFQTKI